MAYGVCPVVVWQLPLPPLLNIQLASLRFHDSCGGSVWHCNRSSFIRGVDLFVWVYLSENSWRSSCSATSQVSWSIPLKRAEFKHIDISCTWDKWFIQKSGPSLFVMRQADKRGFPRSKYFWTITILHSTLSLVKTWPMYVILSMGAPWLASVNL